MQRVLGVPFWRLTTADKQGVALVLKRSLPFGRSWLYVPRGPVFFSQPSAQNFTDMQKQLIHLAKEQRALFVRCDPGVRDSAWVSQLINGGWQKAASEVQPRQTLIVDLGLSEDNLLAAMHPKTRYNIRLAEKKGVSVRFSREASDLEHFLRLSTEVHQRSGFRYHPPGYYRAMQPALGQAFEIGLAEYQGQVVVVHLYIRFGTQVTYAHGASSDEFRFVMAPHLLHWLAMKRAKDSGATSFDFFGIAPEGAGKEHPWYGITRYKLGFGGQRQEYIGAQDLVIDKLWYGLYTRVRRLYRVRPHFALRRKLRATRGFA